MKKPFLTLIALLMASLSFAQSEKANEVMNTLRLANNYFMAKYADPTLPTNVNKIRPSSLWTRAVYYEGLMALYEIDNDQRYIDYTDRWASFHKWEPRNGVKTNDADDQCCGQTYADRYFQSGGDEKIERIIENLNNQMKTPTSVLMIHKDSIDSFFNSNKIPNNKDSYIATMTGNNYIFNNISNLIRLMFNQKMNGKATANWDKVVLIPVTTSTRTSNNTTTIIKVSHDMSLTSTKLVGGSENPHADLKLSVIYSKFSDQ